MPLCSHTFQSMPTSQTRKVTCNIVYKTLATKITITLADPIRYCYWCWSNWKHKKFDKTCRKSVLCTNCANISKTTHQFTNRQTKTVRNYAVGRIQPKRNWVDSSTYKVLSTGLHFQTHLFTIFVGWTLPVEQIIRRKRKNYADSDVDYQFSEEIAGLPICSANFQLFVSYDGGVSRTLLNQKKLVKKQQEFISKALKGFANFEVYNHMAYEKQQTESDGLPFHANSGFEPNQENLVPNRQRDR